MLERLKAIEQRYNDINIELTNPEVIKDIKKMTLLAKEQASLRPAYELYQTYQKVLNTITNDEALINDPDLGTEAKAELEVMRERQTEIEHQIEVVLLPKDPDDSKNIILEIRGAAGGDEGNIFAGDLYRMYMRYADRKGWKVEELDAEPGAAGGYSFVSASIKGADVYSRLKYESGAHRVQRVPITEASGRIQTSTATVLVMPEAEDIDVDLDMNDVRIDITRASGNGGQGVNTTDSAVRVTHIPTGLVVYAQTERSQIKNKEKALKILKTRLYDLRSQEQADRIGSERRSKIGTGSRSEKIRTYNYPQNRVTDHRIGYTTNNLDRIIDGDLDKLLDALINEDQARQISGQND